VTTKWQFPEIRTKDELGLQLQKICEEVDEVTFAWVKCSDESNLAEIAYEAWDVIQATETLLRVLERRGVDVRDVRERVMLKNKQRGRYEEE